MAQYMNSNFELAGPLAGLFGGIQQGQQEEASRLQNIYQDLLNQRYEQTTPDVVAKSNLEGQLAKAKMEGGYIPEATKAAVGEQAVKSQEFDLERGMNNIELARTALDAGVSPEEVAARFNVSLDTPFGQAYLKNPHGALDTAYNNMVKRRANTVKQAQIMQQLEQRGENVLEQIAARSKASGGGVGKPLSMTQYEAQLRQRAAAGDPQAKAELYDLQQERLTKATAGIEARNAPIMNLLQGRQPGAAPAPQAKGGVIKLD
jgi:hypothetical protein